jgi:dUTP pyrophosphatase
VIDSDYRGVIKVLLVNSRVPSSNPHEPDEANPSIVKNAFEVIAGMKIAQIIIHKHCTCDVVEAASLDDTVRGRGGFGSTGV